MKKNKTCYYKEFCDDMIIRDFLALDRTILANRRTLLAYIRTFIGLIAGGIGMVKLVADEITNIIGYAFIISSIPILIIGVIEFFKMKISLSAIVRLGKDKVIDTNNMGES
jgi:putative membrane protein